MAADSRLTRTKPTKTIELPKEKEDEKRFLTYQTTYTLSDNSQKVLLINKTKTGVSFCGDAIIDGVTVADFIRKFEIENVDFEDTTEDIANKLLKYYTGGKTHFFVCGYDNDVPYVFDIYDGKCERQNSENSSKIIHAPQETSPIETDIPENIKNASKDSVVEDTVKYAAIWAGQKTAITKIVNNKPILNADWNTMPLKDAIDFAEFLIDMTIKYERFCDDIQTCGGPVDILVITKDEAFWKQHKIYNPIVG